MLITAPFNTIFDDIYDIMESKQQRRYEFEDNTLKIDLPGIGKNNIKVSIKPKKELLIEVKGKNDTPETLRFLVKEHVSADAKYEDGVLIVKLEPDKKQEPVEVKVA